MLINLSIILLSNSHSFAYYAHRFHLLFSKLCLYFKIHDLNLKQEVIYSFICINCDFQFSKTELYLICIIMISNKTEDEIKEFVSII